MEEIMYILQWLLGVSWDIISAAGWTLLISWLIEILFLGKNKDLEDRNC